MIFVKKSKIYPWYFAAGALLIYTALSVVPGIIGIGYSFTDWSAYSKELHFVGLENFKEVFSPDQDYLKYILNTLVFTSILNPKTGLLNEGLRAIGLDSLAQHWLTDPDIAFWSVMGVDIWRGTGYIMTILIVGILAIPQVYYEADGIDGANGFQKFTYITLPMLKQTLAVTIVLNVLYGLKVFDAR